MGWGPVKVKKMLGTGLPGPLFSGANILVSGRVLLVVVEI